MTQRLTTILLQAALTAAVAFSSVGAAAKPDPPKTPIINKKKQNGHVPGTPEHANRVKQGNPTSTFFGAKSGEALTRDTHATGQPVERRPQLREKTYPFSTGVNHEGGFQNKVRVATDKRGEIHGYPSGRGKK